MITLAVIMSACMEEKLVEPIKVENKPSTNKYDEYPARPLPPDKHFAPCLTTSSSLISLYARRLWSYHSLSRLEMIETSRLG